MVSNTLLHVQNTKGNIFGGYWLSPELLGAVFSLHVHEDNQVPKATDDMMKVEFGLPQGDINYFPIARIQDSFILQQIKWYCERVCVLVKLEYISKENYGILRAVENGRKIGWANLLYIRMNSEIYQKKKRVDRASKIGPFLTALQYYATGMNQLLFTSPQYKPTMHQQSQITDASMRTATIFSQEIEQEQGLNH